MLFSEPSAAADVIDINIAVAAATAWFVCSIWAGDAGLNDVISQGWNLTPFATVGNFWKPKTVCRHAEEQ